MVKIRFGLVKKETWDGDVVNKEYYINSDKFDYEDWKQESKEIMGHELACDCFVCK